MDGGKAGNVHGTGMTGKAIANERRQPQPIAHQVYNFVVETTIEAAQ